MHHYLIPVPVILIIQMIPTYIDLVHPLTIFRFILINFIVTCSILHVCMCVYIFKLINSCVLMAQMSVHLKIYEIFIKVKKLCIV